MRVGVNTLFLIPGEVGGSETYLRDILRHAVPRSPDLEWVLFTNDENHALFQNELGGFPGLRLHPLRFRARSRAARILREQTQLPLAARGWRLDVLWSPGYTAPRYAPCAQVTSVLDMQYQEFPEDLSPLALRATRWLVPMAVRVSRKVITLSEFSRTQIVKYVETPPNAIQVIYPAVDAVFGHAMPETERGRRLASLMPPGPYILCVANTYPHKNVHVLVEAFRRLSVSTDHRLVLVGGEGRGEALVQARLHELDAPHRVTRLSRLARADLVALYQGAACFAFPSLYEGFGLPVLEGMAAGVPVVAAPCGAVAEIGGSTITYADGRPEPFAMALRDVLRLDDAERRKRVIAAQQRAAFFTWERAADETVACLRQASAVSTGCSLP